MSYLELLLIPESQKLWIKDVDKYIEEENWNGLVNIWLNFSETELRIACTWLSQNQQVKIQLQMRMDTYLRGFRPS